MSHFLTHLVQRTLGEDGATVAPRPASRFESVEPAESFGNTEPAAPESPAERVTAGAPKQPRRRSADGPTQALANDGDGATQLQALSERLQEIDGLLASHRSAGAVVRSQQAPPRARVGEGSAPDSAAAKEGHKSNPSPPESDPSDAQRVARPQVIAKSQAREREGSRTQAPIEARMMPVAPSRGGETAPAAFQKDRRREPSAERENPLPLPGKGGIAIAPELVALTGKAGSSRRGPRRQRTGGEGSEKSALTPAPAAPTPTPANVLAPQSASQRPVTAGRNRAAAESTPTINVTIGRIEVRAMPAPPPPLVRKATRQAPAQPSAMSLDEYLRRRNGGTP